MIYDPFSSPVYKRRLSTPIYKIEVCHTPYTVNSDGIEYKLWDNDGWENGGGNLVVDGRVPMIADYWGTGTPIGLSDASPFSIRYDGYFIPPETANYNFYIAGNGECHLYFDRGLGAGLAPQYLTGQLEMGGTKDRRKINGEAPGYYYMTPSKTSNSNIGVALVKGESYWLRFYYRKSASRSGVVLLFANNKNYMEPLPVSAGVMSSDGNLESWTVAPGVSSVRLSENEGSIDQMDFTVPLVENGSDERGYYYVKATDSFEWYDGGGEYLKHQNLIRLSIGYRIDDADEYVQRFVGNIDDFQVERAGSSTIKIVCKSFLNRLKKTLLINQPNYLLYWLAGYMDGGSIKSPPAGDRKPVTFDRWRLNKVVRSLCLLSGIDSVLANKTVGPRAIQRIYGDI